MKAMIFSAGLGTRLKPHTLDRPKALVEVAGKPLLRHVLERVIDAGCREVVINVHHFAGKMVDEIEGYHYPGVTIRISDERDLLLDTGGGLKKATPLLRGNEPILLHNVDILSTTDLNAMCMAHIASGALATLAIRERATSRYLLFDEDLRLFGWKNIKTGEVKPVGLNEDALLPLAFSGIQVIDPALLELITEEGVFSTIPMYLRLARDHFIQGYRHDADTWLDVGKPDQLKKAKELFFPGAS